jgi:hypothetical protein
MGAPRSSTLALALVASALACDKGQPKHVPCSVEADCVAHESCIGGHCISDDFVCGGLQSCPGDLACCSGHCADTACCTIDSECGGGYCNGGACTSGTRPDCAAPEDCASSGGRCLLPLGQCVECVYSDDCPDAALVCSPAHTCVPASSGCTTASCAATGKVCAPEEGGCRDCLSTAECGTRVCDASGTCVPCTASPDNCGQNRVCDGGSCVAANATPCLTNADCGDRVCRQVGSDKVCDDCLLGSECGGGRTCSGGRCSSTSAECGTDADCSPPTTICQADLCEPGCGTTGCTGGQSCSTSTGRCVPTGAGDTTLGQPCNSHDDCQSNVCWPWRDDDGLEHDDCGQACSRHDDCPSGFACTELGDGNVCAPISRFSPATLSSPPGASCDTAPEDLDCSTRWCNPSTHDCLEMCGNDADCAGDPALPAGSKCFSWRPFTDVYTQACDPPDQSLAPAGSICTTTFLGEEVPDHSKCQAGFCMQTPNPFVEPRCAQPCCTPSDCSPSNSICKPIDLYDGVREFDWEPYGFQKSCLWREYAGQKNVGDLCSKDSECKSEICVAGPSGVKRCTQTCCTNGDCADFPWASACRPPLLSGLPALEDDNLDAILLSLGRDTGDGIAWAATTLCMPW